MRRKEQSFFMNATKFNLNSVHIRTCTSNSKEKLFAADVYSHSQSMKLDMQVETEKSSDG